MIYQSTQFNGFQYVVTSTRATHPSTLEHFMTSKVNPTFSSHHSPPHSSSGGNLSSTFCFYKFDFSGEMEQMPCCSSTLLKRGERNIHSPQTRRVYADPRMMLSLNCEILTITYEAMGDSQEVLSLESSHLQPPSTYFFCGILSLGNLTQAWLGSGYKPCYCEEHHCVVRTIEIHWVYSLMDQQVHPLPHPHSRVYLREEIEILSYLGKIYVLVKINSCYC